MFSNFSIGVRLIADFIPVAAVVVVGVVGSSNTRQINGMADWMYDRELLGLSVVQKTNIHLIHIGRARGNFLLASRQEDSERNLASIAKARVNVTGYMELVGKVNSGAESLASVSAQAAAAGLQHVSLTLEAADRREPASALRLAALAAAGQDGNGPPGVDESQLARH